MFHDINVTRDTLLTIQRERIEAGGGGCGKKRGSQEVCLFVYIVLLFPEKFFIQIYAPTKGKKFHYRDKL